MAIGVTIASIVSGGSGGSQNLQQVTDIGHNTTQPIISSASVVAGVSNNSFSGAVVGQGLVTKESATANAFTIDNALLTGDITARPLPRPEGVYNFAFTDDVYKAPLYVNIEDYVINIEETRKDLVLTTEKKGLFLTNAVFPLGSEILITNLVNTPNFIQPGNNICLNAMLSSIDLIEGTPGERMTIPPNSVCIVKKVYEKGVEYWSCNFRIIKEFGASWELVKGDGSPQENGAALAIIYDQAASKSPYFLPLSTTNRYTIVVSPGNYIVPPVLFVVSEFIDIVSLTGESDVFINQIVVSANDVKIKGLNLANNPFLVLDNCIDGVFEKCKGGNNSFTGNNTNLDFNATAIDCVAGNSSFGGINGNLGTTAKTIRCIAGTNSFGMLEHKGFSNDCVGGSDSFGGLNGISGIIINSKITTGAFSGVIAAGKTRFCLNADFSIDSQG